MTAEIYQLPRFAGEQARKFPSSGEEIASTEALRILANWTHEWYDRIQDMLDEGPYFVRENGRDHILVDGATMQAMGADMHALSRDLRYMAALFDEEDGSGET